MHMADALISPIVGSTMIVVSSATLWYCQRKAKASFDKVPLMGIMGAFVFACQMINFSIPATGSSGHITGAILLCAILGSYRAYLVMACILAIQAFLFADGGIFALGCNLFNMAFWACFLAYPFIFKPIIENKQSNVSNLKIMVASILSCIVASQLGAFSVVLETLLSGITALPFKTFTLLMQPIHLAIGSIEGIATATLIILLKESYPKILTENKDLKESKISILAMSSLAILLVAFASIFASANPDGLEWSLEKTQKDEIAQYQESTTHKTSNLISEKSAIFPDYSLTNNSSIWSTPIAGLAGSLITLITISLLGIFTLKKFKTN